MNARIRKRSEVILLCIVHVPITIYPLPPPPPPPRSYIHNDLKVAVVGPKVDLTYQYQVLKGGGALSILHAVHSEGGAFLVTLLLPCVHTYV